MNTTIRTPDENLDPITGTPGAHPAGTGVGAASGGIAGAMVGSAAGPMGMAVGAAVGAIAGGLAGKAAAESINPTTVSADADGSSADAVTVVIPTDPDLEDAFWRAQYRKEPYFTEALRYEDYEPAYRTGYLGGQRLVGNQYADIESELERDYSANRGSSALSWLEARAAVRAAWDRTTSSGMHRN